MNIKYDNSLYCTNPPQTIAEPLNPNELMEDVVAQHLDEEKYFHDYLDVEEIIFRELIENGQSKELQ